MARRSAAMTAHHGKKLLFLVIGLTVLLAAVLIIGALGDRQPDRPEPKQQSVNNFMLDRRTYNGKTYVERTGITSLLLMGVDRTDLSPVQTGYRAGGQADFLLLMVMDASEKKVSLLHINRDTMVVIEYLQDNDFEVYVCSGSDRFICRNLLEGIELSQFCSINMDAMPELNDLLGGVTVTMPDDYPDLDPAYVKGARITLTGRQAYDFVHDRMTVGDGTNLSRMKRQRAYMEAVQDILQKKLSGGDTDFVSKLFDTLGESLTTNVPKGQIINEAAKAAKYAVQPVQQLEGTTKMGRDGHVQFYADQSWIVNWVLNTYFRPE